MRRIMVTGSRDWTHYGIIYDAFIRRHHFGFGKPQITLVHGACPDGADALALRIAKHLDWYDDPFPAKWSQGRGAGLARNTEMAQSGVDECLAFFMPCSRVGCNRGSSGHWSHGTAHAAEAARSAKVPVTRYMLDVQGNFSVEMPPDIVRDTFFVQEPLDGLEYW